MWVRGSRHDYDQWAANGAEGWSYAEVLPYFIRMEDSKAAEVDRGTTLRITYHSHQDNIRVQPLVSSNKHIF